MEVPNSKRVLLVQPAFPIPPKRKIHHESIPIGLLKIGTYLRDALNCSIQLVVPPEIPDFVPDEIWITSLFTYWAKYVNDAAIFYKMRFPNAKVVVGGIYASLMPDHVRENPCIDEVFVGIHDSAEEWCRNRGVDYGILGVPCDIQILHGMRGCFRKCKFCGTWKIETKEEFDLEFYKRIEKKNVVFYDNNFLRNPEIVKNLESIAEMRKGGKKIVCESQSGFDGRILTKEIAVLLRNAGFKNPRIAWDNSFEDLPQIEKQVQMLKDAGFSAKDIYIFVLYNWEYDYDVLERKRAECYRLGVQISDCRFRPLTATSDNFSSRMIQSDVDYFINSPKWSDYSVKRFRSSVRKHNICVRHNIPFHSSILERKLIDRDEYGKMKKASKEEILRTLPDAWFPQDFHSL